MMKQSLPSNGKAKIIMVGNSGVGKTSFLCRFCDSEFSESYVSTIGINYKRKTLNLDGKDIQVEIWDTAGQERYSNIIAPSVFKKLHGVILSYAVTDRDSFNKVKSWAKTVQDSAQENVCMILVGTKIDMSDRRVSYEEGRTLAGNYGIRFFETSAKEDLNVNDAIEALAKDIKKQFLDESMQNRESNDKPMALMLSTERKRKSGACCS